MSSESPPRIALFLCDTPIPTVRAVDGIYTDIFNTLLRKSRPDLQYVLDPYDVREKQEYPRPEDLAKYDAIMLTGSCTFIRETMGIFLSFGLKQLRLPTRIWTGLTFWSHT